jgi:predicted transcriptional regulator
MEVHLSPGVQAKLEQMARESGRPSHELVEDAVAGYFDELAHTREMLDRRLMEKTEAQRRCGLRPYFTGGATPA